MSRPCVAQLAVCAAFLLGAVAPSAGAHAADRAIVGTLQRVDGQTLILETPKGREIVIVAPSVPVRAGSKTMSIADLAAQAGARVKVRYIDSGGRKAAQSVTIAAVRTGTRTI